MTKLPLHQYREVCTSPVCSELALDPTTWMSFSDLQACEAKAVLRELYDRPDDHEDAVRPLLTALGHSISLAAQCPEVTRHRRWVDAQKTLIRRLEIVAVIREGASPEYVKALHHAQEMSAKPKYLREDFRQALDTMELDAHLNRTEPQHQRARTTRHRGRRAARTARTHTLPDQTRSTRLRLPIAVLNARTTPLPDGVPSMLDAGATPSLPIAGASTLLDAGATPSLPLADTSTLLDAGATPSLPLA
eukprot:PhM_4_TR2388/c1_g1_i1/m.10347